MRHPRHGAALGVWFLLASVALGAQSAQFSGDVLLTEQLTIADAVYLVGLAAGIVPIDSQFDDAPNHLTRAGIRVPEATPGSPISLGEYAFLIVQTFDLPGGLMYSFFPGPRYALRELVYLDVVEPGAHAGEKLTGRSALAILASAMEEFGQ